MILVISRLEWLISGNRKHWLLIQTNFPLQYSSIVDCFFFNINSYLKLTGMRWIKGAIHYINLKLPEQVWTLSFQTLVLVSTALFSAMSQHSRQTLQNVKASACEFIFWMWRKNFSWHVGGQANKTKSLWVFLNSIFSKLYQAVFLPATLTSSPPQKPVSTGRGTIG